MISSLTNQKVKDWCKLHQKKYRDEQGLFLIEEEHLIQEALSVGIVETIITTKENHSWHTEVHVEVVDQKVMDKISKNVSSVSHIAVCHYPNVQSTHRKRILILDHVQDPGNVGTMIRTALSFGFDQVLLSKECCDIYNEKCLRASQGAIFKIAIEVLELTSAIQSLKDEGFFVVGTSLQESISVDSLSNQQKMAFIVGNEGQGVTQEVLSLTDQNIIIPIANFESLNVGVAAGILCYLFKTI